MRPLLSTCVLALCSSFAALSAAAAAPDTAPLKIPELKYETYTLPNGLKVITHEDHRLPLVAIDLWYHVGPLNERPGRTGFAHLFEHMMFEGSEHVGEKAHIKYVEAAGATDVNGTTDFDRTNYYETLPSNQLALGLWLESDRMGFLLEGLDRTRLANQRDVVRNERREHEGTPYDLADEEIYHLIFPAGHPYYGDVMGSHADIEAARIADVRDFHQQYYTPNNASIAIAGDFKPAELRALIEKYFGPIPKGPTPPPVNVVTPAITTQGRATVTDTVQLERLSIAFLTPPAYTPDAYDLDTLAATLTQGRAARLTQVLVNQKQIAQSVSCENASRKLTGILQCDLTAKPGVKLADLEAVFWAEIAKLQADGPTADEVESAKAVALTGQISALQRLGGSGGVADTLDEYNQYTGDPGFLPKDIAMLQAVTPASAKAAAAKYLNQQQSVVVSTVPGEKVLHDVPRSPDSTDADVKLTPPYSVAFEQSQEFRRGAPAPGPEPTFHLPVPKTFTLKNGLQVYLLEDKSLPIVSMQLTSRAGGENDTEATAGVANFNALAMSQATTTRNLTQLAEDERRIGMSIGVSATMDSAHGSMTVLSNHTDQGLDLLADVVQRPAYTPQDVDRLRRRLLVAIAQETDDPMRVAFLVAPDLLYHGQPYGLPSLGMATSVKAITDADLKSFYAAHFGPGDSALSIAGDVTEAEAHRLAETYFGSWSGNAVAAPTLPVPPPPPTRHFVVIDKPGSPQTALAALGFGVPENSPDSEALDVMNYTLGGAFASRINMNLREQHGYTYGAATEFHSYRQGGFFYAEAQVRTDVTGPAVKELFNELGRFPANPPTAAELKEAKDSSVHSIPGFFETASSMASAEAHLFVYNKPLNFYTTLPDRYRAVTSAEVARVAAEYIHPDNLIVVAVGDKKVIGPQLEATGLGPVEQRTVQGALVTAAQPASH